MYTRHSFCFTYALIKKHLICFGDYFFSCVLCVLYILILKISSAHIMYIFLFLLCDMDHQIIWFGCVGQPDKVNFEKLCHCKANTVFVWKCILKGEKVCRYLQIDFCVQYTWFFFLLFVVTKNNLCCILHFMYFCFIVGIV